MPNQTGQPRARSSLLRMVVLTVPGQLLGVVLAGLLLGAAGTSATATVPYLLFPVLAGVVGGVVVGLLVPVPPPRVSSFLRASGLVATVSWLALTTIAQLRLPAGSPRPVWFEVLLGLLLVVAPHVAACAAVWRARRHR